MGGMNVLALRGLLALPGHSSARRLHKMTGGCSYIFIKEKINEAEERFKFLLAQRANKDTCVF